MQGGFGPRFALEAGFLIALAIAAGVAQLSATAIIVVMAVAWLLICLFELAAWAEGPRFPVFHRRATAVEPDEITPADRVRERAQVDESAPAAEPAPLTEVDASEENEGRRRFWRRRRAASGGGA